MKSWRRRTISGPGTVTTSMLPLVTVAVDGRGPAIANRLPLVTVAVDGRGPAIANRLPLVTLPAIRLLPYSRILLLYFQYLPYPMGRK